MGPVFHKSRTVTCLFLIRKHVGDVLGKAGHCNFSWDRKIWGALVEVCVSAEKMGKGEMSRSLKLDFSPYFSNCQSPYNCLSLPLLLHPFAFENMWKTRTNCGAFGGLESYYSLRQNLLLWALSFPCLRWCVGMAENSVTACSHTNKCALLNVLVSHPHWRPPDKN